MNQNTKRLVILNLPYILMGLYATNLGWAWRMAAGADMTEKVQSLMTVPAFTLWTCWWVYAVVQGCAWRSTSRAKTPRSTATAANTALHDGEAIQISNLTLTRYSRTM